jgi:murein DD-endopeptidase MepM/ murein hydrolase activator NlpD
MKNLRLEKRNSQEEKWKKELKNITREKSDLQALIRVKKKEQNEFMNKKIIQEESFENEGSVSLLKWFFSDKTVAQILEEKRTIREKETQYKLQLKNLQTLKKKLDEKEAHTALLFHTTSSLREKITKEKQSLDRLTEAKARLIARLEYSYGKTQKEIANYQREQNQSTVLLQNLHQALEKIKTNEKIVVSETDISKKLIFDFPLPIERKITAHFRDEAYQERFGKEHIGVDFFAPQGTDILAPSDGIVQKVALNGYGYSYLVLNHGNELYTVYGHISDSFVNEGQKVFKGDKIALTGGTPGTVGAGYFTTGPHLHWEVFDRGKHRNPMHYLD